MKYQRKEDFFSRGEEYIKESIAEMKRIAAKKAYRKAMLRRLADGKNEVHKNWYRGEDLPNLKREFLWLRDWVRKRKERKSLDYFVVKYFRQLRCKYNNIIFRKKRRIEVLQYLKVRYPRMYGRAIAKLAKQYKEYCIKNGLNYEAYHKREVSGENFKQFWSWLRHSVGKLCSKSTVEKFVGFLYRMRSFIFGIKYSVFFIHWNDTGIFFIYIAVSLVFYFILAALLKKVAKRVTTKDDFCVYKKNQVFFDYDRGGFVFYSIMFFLLIMTSFYLFLLFYSVLVWAHIITDGLIGYNFVRFWIYYITFCNGLLAWYFFNNLRPYYFVGAQKIFWYFVSFGCLVFIFWGISVTGYLIFCFFLAIFLSGKPIYRNVEDQEYKNRGFDINHDKRNVRTKSGSKTITAIVANMSRARRK